MSSSKDVAEPAEQQAPDDLSYKAAYGGGGIVERFTRWLAFAGGGLLLVAIALTLISVTGRYIFSQPLPGDYEIVEITCAIAIFLFFPYTHATNSNITAEFFTSGLSVLSKRALDLIHDVVFALVAALLTWRLSTGLAEKFSNGETSILVSIPLWIPYSFAVMSLALLTMVCLWRIARGVGALLR